MRNLNYTIYTINSDNFKIIKYKYVGTYLQRFISTN